MNFLKYLKDSFFSLALLRSHLHRLPNQEGVAFTEERGRRLLRKGRTTLKNRKETNSIDRTSTPRSRVSTEHITLISDGCFPDHSFTLPLHTQSQIQLKRKDAVCSEMEGPKGVGGSKEEEHLAFTKNTFSSSHIFLPSTSSVSFQDHCLQGGQIKPRALSRQ